MKKVLIVVGVIAVIISIVAFSAPKEIYGSWNVSERSKDESFSKYPEVGFNLNDDGTFTADGMSGTYSKDEETIKLCFLGISTYTYEYKLSGNTLTLKYLGRDDSPKIYYERAK